MDDEFPQPVRLACHDGAQVLRLSGVINIMAAEALLASARSAAAATGPVVVDGAGAESFDMSALQILVALQRELGRQGRRLRLTHVGRQAAEDLALAGLSRVFDGMESGGDRPAAAPAGVAA